MLFSKIFRYELCMKRLQVIETKWRSCPCVSLAILCIVPAVFIVFSVLHSEQVWGDLSFAPLIDNPTLYLPGPSETFAAETITLLSVVALLLFIISITECCLRCNVSFIRGVRADERKREILTFVYFLITFFVACVPTACLHFYIYYYMNHFNISNSELMYNVVVDEFRTSLKKIQVVYECCGIQNYT